MRARTLAASAVAGAGAGAGAVVVGGVVSARRNMRAFEVAMAPARAMAERLRADVAASRLVLDRAGADFDRWPPERRALELELARIELDLEGQQA